MHYDGAQYYVTEARVNRPWPHYALGHVYTWCGMRFSYPYRNAPELQHTRDEGLVTCVECRARMARLVTIHLGRT